MSNIIIIDNSKALYRLVYFKVKEIFEVMSNQRI